MPLTRYILFVPWVDKTTPPRVTAQPLRHGLGAPSEIQNFCIRVFQSFRFTAVTRRQPANVKHSHRNWWEWDSPRTKDCGSTAWLPVLSLRRAGLEAEAVARTRAFRVRGKKRKERNPGARAREAGSAATSCAVAWSGLVLHGIQDSHPSLLASLRGRRHKGRQDGACWAGQTDRQTGVRAYSKRPN